MSIYESLRLSSDNDFGTAGRLGRYPRIPVLNADQPAEIVGLTAPDKRPSPETLNLAPPFERFFIECSLPKSLQFQTSHGTETGKSVESTVLEVGLDVRVDRNASYPHTSEESQPHWQLLCLPFLKVDTDPAKHDPLCVSDFLIHIGLRSDGFPAQFESATNELLSEWFTKDGTVFWVGQDAAVYRILARHRGGGNSTWDRVLRSDHKLAELHELTMQQFNMYLPLLYALNSLHNKRTVVVQNQPSRQVRRAAQRSGQQPPDQHTIVVKDFVKIINDARKAQSGGNQYPLGEVIGHWRNYGVNGRTGLLFGRYRGTFFIPSFLRGNPDEGATDHDYVLKAGAAA